MKKNLLLFLMLSLLVATSSCTVVVTKNIPGKKLGKIPVTFHGNYQLETDNPDLFYINDAEMKFSIKENGIEMSDSEKGTEFTELGDSLYWSVAGKNHYVSMGEGLFTVFKMKKVGEDIHLFSMYANSGTTQEDFEKYFKSVEQDLSSEETGVSTFMVEVNDKKLEKYFKSGLVSKDPLKLVKK